MKRLFILPWLVLCAVAILHSVWALVSGGGLHIGWLGAFLANLLPLSFMFRLMKTTSGRASKWLPLEVSVAAAGTAMAYIYGPPLALFYAAVIGLLGTLMYVFWYSKLGRRKNEQLEVGQQLPPFRLTSTEGHFYTPTQAGVPSVLLFVRGAWCPLCVAQVGELAALYQRLSDAGAQVFVIAAQTQQQTESLAKRFDVPLIFCVDDHNTLANELGLLHAGGTPFGVVDYSADTLYPTVVITNRSGKIIYSDQTDNYRIRPEPEQFLAVLSANAAASS